MLVWVSMMRNSYVSRKGSRLKLPITIQPAVVLALVQSGWSADRLLETTFHSVNGFTNVNAAADATYRATPEFLRFVRVVFGLQRENAIAFRGRAPAGGQSPAASETSASEGAFLKFYVEKMSPETRQEFELMRQDLGLSTETDTYRVVWGLQAPNDRTMAVQSRSVLGFMAALTLYVEVPPWDLEDQSAPDPVPVPESPNGGEPMMRIRSGAEAPANPYVAVRYDGDWFWIDKSDNNSKRTFAYLSLLLTVSEGGESSGSPLVLTVN